MKPYPAYKDSDFLLLGQVPQSWCTRRLKFVTDVIVSNVDKHTVEGQTPVRLCNYTDVYYNAQISSALLFMEATATEEQISKFRLLSGDVLITKDSETASDIAVPAVIVEDVPGVICGYHLALLRCKKPMLGAYLRYVLASPPFRDHFRTAANGVTRVGLSYADINTALVVVPPLSEQAAIVAFLDHKNIEIDAFIAKKRHLIALLNDQKAAIIHQAVTKGMDPNVPMKPSGLEWLGDIPAHWEVRRNASCFTERVERGDAALPLLMVSIQSGVTIGTEDELDPKRTIEDRTAYKLTRRDDIAYNTMRMWQGAIGVVPEDGLVSPAYVVAKPLSGAVSQYYSFLYRTDMYKHQVNCQSRGIVPDRNRLYWADFRQMPTIFPPSREQEAIVAYVKARESTVERVIGRIEREIELIQEYRTTLISDAVTGKIDVREASATVALA